MPPDKKKDADQIPPPPSASDGPQEPVDWRELEEEGHATLPEGGEDGGDS